MSTPLVEVRWARRWSGMAGCPDVYEKPLTAADMTVTMDGRPLVVICPDDGSQLERLAKAFHESDHLAPWHDLHQETRSQICDAMQAALRSLIADPKPDEPTGLGAVVEVESRLDGVGKRLLVRTHATNEPWFGDGIKQAWADIQGPVRIVSEGVDA